jgi:hypothetical protein
VPNGSVWARNPIPRNAIGTQSAYQGQGFEMPPGCAKLWGAQNMSKCQMMTDGSNSVPDMEIIDRVAIPPGTPAGEYVLGWRWDCEVISLPPCPCGYQSIYISIAARCCPFGIDRLAAVRGARKRTDTVLPTC